MRGALLVVVAITLLIVGILVIKNMQPDPDELSKKEVIEKAEKTAEAAEDAVKHLEESTRRAMEMN